MRDPTYVSLPDRWGVLPLDQEEEVYYELRLPKSPLNEENEEGEEEEGAKATPDGAEPKLAPKKRALLVMGAFASLRWLDNLADRLASEGFEVCSYNHRGIPLGSYVDLSGVEGKSQKGEEGADDDGHSTTTATASSSSDGSDFLRSRSSSCTSSCSTSSTTSTSTSTSTSTTSSKREARRVLADHHTCELLASDGWRLVEHVWGEGTGPVHVYGASMGGMIAQQMAVQELRRAEKERRPSRVASLFLAVTSRGMYPLPIPGIDGLARRLMPPLYKTGLIRLALPFFISSSKERMLRHLLNKCFRQEYLDSQHEETGEPMRAVWERAWGENFDDWSTFSCPETCANQLMTIASFYLSDEDAARLKKRVPLITVQIATHDVVVPTFMQEALAGLIGANKLYVEGGHMLDTVEKERFWRDTMEHFVEAGEWGVGGASGEW